MPTPHISAPQGAFAKTVLMAGDPLRAKFVAEKYLQEATMVTAVRNMYGYTGTYKGRPISVMGSGMGKPSIGIYTYELYDEYGVENIVRIGSAGSYRESLNVMDVVLVNQSYSDSTYARMMNGCIDKVIMPSPDLNEIITQTAVERNVPLKLAAVHSTDVFYVDPRMESFLQLRDRTKADCVEMESFALFHNANVLGRRAACLLTISDSFCTKTEISSAERETSLTVMIELALESAIRF
ncbi:MAG: purine-nucleoside phosphorylase [Bacteroidaceae bacterium]|nr:purine-nucleoside phosphorylase [Bacteroidaceae bacterium]